MTVVELPATPDVQVLGDAAVIRGAAAVDAYRVLAEGIRSVCTRDGISPPPRLLRAAAALKAAAQAAPTRSDMADTTDVRGGRAGAVLVSHEPIGIEEVAAMAMVGQRQARRLATTLGGRKTRSGRWIFDRGVVERYLTIEQRERVAK